MQNLEAKQQLSKAEQLIALGRHKQARKLLLYMEEPSADELLEQVDDVLALRTVDKNDREMNADFDKWRNRIEQEKLRISLKRDIDRHGILLSILISCLFLLASTDFASSFRYEEFVALGFLNVILLPLNYHPIALIALGFILGSSVKTSWDGDGARFTIIFFIIVLGLNSYSFYFLVFSRILSG